MADDLEAFLYSSPSLVRQEERNIHTNNLNTLEFMERRLDDRTFAVGIMVDNCLEYNSNGYDLPTQQLFQLYSIIRNLGDQYTEICSLQRDYSVELGYICPVYRTGIQGWGRLYKARLA